MPSPDPDDTGTAVGAPGGDVGAADSIQELETALRRSGRSENGIQSVLTDVRQLREFAGNRSLLEFQRADVMAFLHWLETERGHKPASMKRKLASVRLLFDFYRRQEKLDANPADGIGIVSPAAQRPLPLTPAQSRRLVSAASSDNRWHVLVLLMLTAGLKREEVVRLRWTDVSRDFRTRVTQIVHTGTVTRRAQGSYTDRAASDRRRASAAGRQSSAKCSGERLCAGSERSGSGLRGGSMCRPRRSWAPRHHPATVKRYVRRRTPRDAEEKRSSTIAWVVASRSGGCS